ncbi:hypothetical protein ZWY2020_057765 [Hordeum vulgare]|nr:hypothetical protein ZWY2020_057765 [Hordeum vulgare]
MVACMPCHAMPNFRQSKLSLEEMDRLMTVVANPRQFKVPDWFFNRKDYKDGRFSQAALYIWKSSSKSIWISWCRSTPWDTHHDHRSPIL